MKMLPLTRALLLALGGLAGAASALAAADAQIAAEAARQKAPYLDTLKEYVSIETGSRDIEGLDKLAALLAGKLRALGGKVDLIEPTGDAVHRMEDTPEKIGKVVQATFSGSGSRKIMLIAHMDTVYQRGQLAQQPFRIEGDKAFGLGIADDKQGVALITHIVALLKALDFREYGQLTVLVNGDEEISSPGSRALLTRLGAEHDVVMSFEGASARDDKLSLATAGIGAVALKVTGKASHAGSAPQLGVNALYELSHQVLQMRDLSDPATGLKLNWTVASAGSNRNVIPASATASADVRVLKVADYDRVEKAVAERIQKKLIPEAKVEMNFERRRPPLQDSAASRALATHAQAIYKELDRPLGADTGVAGGGTDAAFAGLQARGAVVERFGLQGFGAHSADAEYVLIDSIEPRLYLAARLIMDVSRGRVPGL